MRSGGMLARGATVFAIRVAGAAVTYLTQVVLARWIGGAELGRYVEATAWCFVLANLGGLGLPAAAMRFVGAALGSDRRDLARGFLIRGRQVVIATSTGLAALAAAVVLWVSGAEGTAMLVSLAGVPLMAQMRLQNSIANSFSWLPLAFLPNNLVRPLLLLGALVAAWQLGWLGSAVDVVVLHVVIMVLILAVQGYGMASGLRSELGSVAPSFATAEWLRVSVALSFMYLFTQYFIDVNVVISGLLLGDSELAMFNVVLRTAMFVGFGINAFDAVVLPLVSRAYAAGDLATVQQRLVVATRLKVAGALAALGIFALVGERVLAIFGAEFAAGQRALLIAAAAQVVRAALGAGGEVLGITGHERRCLAVYGGGLIAVAVLQVILVPLLGVDGAALAMLLTVGLTSAHLARTARRRLGIGMTIFASTRPRP